MSSRRMVALGIVALLHVFLGYAFITGLALKAVHVITGPMQVKEIKEEVKKDEPPPPPPPDLQDIPPYVPPPDVQVETTAPPPPITIQTTVPAPPPPIHVNPPVVAPPAPSGPTQIATPKGRLQQTFGDPANYPDASIRAGEQGTVSYQIEIDEKGNVTPGSCKITASSGSDRLDKQTCFLFDRRGRGLFNPALQNGTPMKAQYAGRFTWRLPKE